MSQAEMLLHPTRATKAMEDFVCQCSWCGLLVSSEKPDEELGPCPGCRTNIWWAQDYPVGPFKGPKGRRKARWAR